MSGISSEIYKIFCLTSPKSDLIGLSAIIEENINTIFKNLGKTVELNRPDCCASAFEALSDCRNINIRFFVTTDDCYSKSILRYASYLPEHSHAINIDIVATTNTDYIKRYDPSDRRKTIIITQEELMNIDKLSLFIKSIVNPINIYISYGNDQQGESRQLISLIEKYTTLCLPYVNIVYDLKKKYKDDITRLVEEIKSGEYVILIINKKYLKSEYAMAEYVGIVEKSKSEAEFIKRIYPIILKSGEKIRDKKEVAELIDYWEKEYLQPLKSWISNKNNKIENSHYIELEREIIVFEKIIDHLQDIDKTLGKFVALDKETHVKTKFSTIIWSIHERIVENGGFRLYKNEKEIKLLLNEA